MNGAMKSNNFVQMIKGGLERNLKEAVTNSIVKDMVADFEKRAKEVVMKEVEKVTFAGVERLSDMCRMRDEVVVFVKWDDGRTVEK